MISRVEPIRKDKEKFRLVESRLKGRFFQIGLVFWAQESNLGVTFAVVYEGESQLIINPERCLILTKCIIFCKYSAFKM